MGTWYRLQKDGRRVGMTMLLSVGEPVMPGFREAKTARERLLLNRPERALFNPETGVLEPKKTLRLVAERMTVKADGQDEVLVRIVGLPEEDEMEVVVAGIRDTVRGRDGIRVRAAPEQAGRPIHVRASHPYFVIEPVTLMGEQVDGPPR